MKYTHTITGMTCKSCKATIEKQLSGLEEVTSVGVNLEKGLLEVQMSSFVSAKTLQAVLPKKYTIDQIRKEEKPVNPFLGVLKAKDASKFKQLRPLFLVLFYIATASALLNHSHWNWSAFMLDFMGLFFIVFSFFKMLDLKGFPDSFKMYDPLAKKSSLYAALYPFVETALGLMFLMRYETVTALWVTLIVLGITSYGVGRILFDKKTIRCACLGTTLKLPMTEATFIENAIMITMTILTLNNLMQNEIPTSNHSHHDPLYRLQK